MLFFLQTEPTAHFHARTYWTNQRWGCERVLFPFQGRHLPFSTVPTLASIRCKRKECPAGRAERRMLQQLRFSPVWCYNIVTITDCSHQFALTFLFSTWDFTLLSKAHHGHITFSAPSNDTFGLSFHWLFLNSIQRQRSACVCDVRPPGGGGTVLLFLQASCIHSTH